MNRSLFHPAFRPTQKEVSETFSFGNYLETDGVDDFVSFSSGLSPINNETNASVHVWFNVGAGDVANFGSVNGLNRFNILKFSDNNVYWQVGDNPTNSRGVCSFSGFENTWALLSLCFDGNGLANDDKLRAYINGVQQSMTFNNPIPSAIGGTVGNNFRINEYLGIVGQAGYDEAVLTLDSSTPEQILSYYNNGNGATPESCFTNILAAWNFNQEDGDSTLNPSIGTAVGTLQNFSGNYFFNR